MIGVYDYTVILTYASLLSASAGIVASLLDGGHPYIATFFLLFCGLFDGFDGKVARLKKDRTSESKRFGIQIDSLSDLVAFGVLPVCIGISFLRTSEFFHDIMMSSADSAWYFTLLKLLFYAILLLYVLAAMIRLAYYNVTEEDRQQTETGDRKVYMGLPVTASSLLLPAIVFLRYFLKQISPAFDTIITALYVVAIVAIGTLFLAKIPVKKPGIRGIVILIGIGVIEAAAIAIIMIWHNIVHS